MGAALLATVIGPAAIAAAGPSPGLDAVTTAEDTPVTGNVLLNDTGTGALSVVGYTPLGAQHGSLVIAANGDLSYTPAANWHGVVSTTYWVKDDLGSSLGYVQLNVSSVNDAPVAADDAAVVVEDTATDVTEGLIDNDTDVEQSSLSIAGVSDASGGTVDLSGGVVTFTPDADVCGAGAGGFHYEVSDGDLSDTGHVTVDITCVADAPVAVDDTGFAAQAGGAQTFGVLKNDTDGDGDTLHVTGADVDAAVGTVTVVADEIVFTPVPAFAGDAVISYTVSDGDLTDKGTLTVTVEADTLAPVPTAPTVAFGSGRVNETAPLAISWSAVDAGVGVKSYEVQASVGGGTFATIYSGANTSVTKAYPFGKSLVFRVRATDNLDNTSDWVTAATRSMAAYQAPGSSRIAYSTGWTTVLTSSASGVGYRYTSTLGRRATLTFTGLSVLYVAPRTSTAGYAKVYVDGKVLGRYNLRRSTTAHGQIIARASWGVSGSHTIRVANDQGGRRTTLDAFVVLR